MVRIFVALPPWLRGLVWRHLPHSPIRRATIENLVRWQYRQLNETGVIPTELVSPDVEVHQAPELIGTAGTFHGHDGLQAMWAELHEAWGSVEFEPVEIREFGHRRGLVVVARARNVGLGSGTVTNSEVAHVYWAGRFGTITRCQTYWEPKEAFEAVGLRT